MLPAVREADQRIAGHVLGEAGAAVAEDAALAVEVDEVADRERLGVVALLLHEPALARTVAERLVLQRALAALVAHRAVERVVDEQELQHALLRLLHARPVRVDLHALGHVGHARHGQRRAPAGVDVDEAHAAHAHRLHALVVAEAGDVGAGALRGGDQQLARLGLDVVTVDGDRDGGLLRCLGRRVRHGRPPRGRRRAPNDRGRCSARTRHGRA